MPVYCTGRVILYANKLPEKENELMTLTLHKATAIRNSERRNRQMKKSATPATLNIAPAISTGVIFSLLIQSDGASIRTGVIDIMVEAMPASVYLTDSREKEIPRKGPKKAPSVTAFMAERFLNEMLT